MFKAYKNILTPEIYQKLREKILEPHSIGDVKIAIKNDLFNLLIMDTNNSKVVGMVRVIGDGRINFVIKDFIVIKEYRKKYIGKLIMDEVKKYLDDNASENAYIFLLAKLGSEEFYKKMGFKTRAEMNLGPGMMIKRKEIRRNYD